MKEIVEAAHQFEQAAQLEEAQIASMDSFIEKKQTTMEDMQKEMEGFGALTDQNLVQDQKKLVDSLKK